MDFPYFLVELSSAIQNHCEAEDSSDLLLTANVSLSARIAELGVFSNSTDTDKALSAKNQALLISLLAEVVLWACVIGVIQQVGLDVVDDEFLEGVSEESPDVCLHDRFLCANDMLFASSDLMSMVWNPPFDGEDDAEEEPDPVGGDAEEEDLVDILFDGSNDEEIIESSPEFDAIVEILSLAKVFLNFYGENQVFSDVYRKALTLKLG